MPCSLTLTALLLLLPQLTQRGLPLEEAERGPRPSGLVLVSGYNSNSLHAYDVNGGRQLKRLRGVRGAQSVTPGPDGLLYVVAEKTDQVLRIDPHTLQRVDVFVGDDPATPQDESGGLDAPTAATFGPDKHLYVASFSGDSVLRYDGTTGAFLDVFVAPRSGGLDGPDAGLRFGPDGHLYVPSFNSDEVLRYRGNSGDFLDAFVPRRLGGLRAPRHLEFREGDLFVSSWRSNRILRYDGNGAFLGAFAVVTRPTGFGFHPVDGHLYVTSDNTQRVRIYHGATGAFLETLVAGGGGGLNGGTFVSFLP